MFLFKMKVTPMKIEKKKNQAENKNGERGKKV